MRLTASDCGIFCFFTLSCLQQRNRGMHPNHLRMCCVTQSDVLLVTITGKCSKRFPFLMKVVLLIASPFGSCRFRWKPFCSNHNIKVRFENSSSSLFWQPHLWPSGETSSPEAYPIWPAETAENYKLRIFLIHNFAANTKLQTLIKFPLIFSCKRFRCNMIFARPSLPSPPTDVNRSKSYCGRISLCQFTFSLAKNSYR